MTTHPKHPFWCGQGHLCSAERGGEHRSESLTFPTDYGALVLTRTRTTAGRDRLEVRTVVTLNAHGPAARTEAVDLIRSIDATTRTALMGQRFRRAA